MESYACYVHLTGSETPELRFYSAEGATALTRALSAVTHEWPNFERIEVRDSHDRVVGRFSRTECLGLPARAAKASAEASRAS